jgi:hypothetical protein
MINLVVVLYEILLNSAINRDFLRLKKLIKGTQVIKLFIARATTGVFFYHRLMEMHNFLF